MLASLDEILSNPHTHQAMRQGGANDSNIDAEGKSEHRFSHRDIPFTMELKMDGQDIPEQEYVDLKHLDSSVLHWGQMKLLLGEIEFLTPYMHIQNLCVVYVGSAPGHHLKVLVDLMPETWTWELYDDRPCEVFCENHIGDIILEKYSSMPSRLKKIQKSQDPETTDELQSLLNSNKTAEAYEKYKSTHYEAIANHLIKLRKEELEQRIKEESDTVDRLKMIGAPSACTKTHTNILHTLQHTIPIARVHRHNVRTHNQYVDYKEALQLRQKYVTRPQTDEDPQLLCISDIRTPLERITESSVEHDMNQQRSLLQVMGPHMASLKFKMPYSENFPLTQIYLDGQLYFQPFSPRVSHECRLITDCKNTRLYNREEYAKKLFYFQSALRTSVYDEGDPLPNEVDHPNLVSNGVGTDRCFDCTAARQIIRNMGKGDTLMVLDDIVRQLVDVQVACKADGNGTLEE